MDAPNYIGLFFALIVFIITPGVGVAVLLARTITAGMTTGMLLGAGMIMGDLVYAGAVLLTLSSIADYIVPYLFYIRVFGAGYLGYLGFKQMQKGVLVIETEKKKSTNFKSFLFGLIISLTNPKVMVFYFGFLPLFVPLGGMDLLSITYTMFAIGAGAFVGLGMVLWGCKGLKKILTSADAKKANRIIGGLMMLCGGLLII